MIALLALRAVASDHDVAAPASVTARAVPIPDGPPVQVRVAAGEPLQAAVDAAPAGSTLVLAPGTHRGGVVLDRPLSLLAEPGATLDGGGVGSVLTLAADDVVVRGLRITGSGSRGYADDAGVVVAGRRFRLEGLTVDRAWLGIDLRRAHDGVVTGCEVRGDASAPFGLRGDGIRLWESDGNRLEHNRLTDVRDLVVWYSERNVLVDNEVSRSRYGTHLMHASGTRVEGNRYQGDVVGVFVMYSADVELAGNTVTGAGGEAGVGLGFKESDRIHATGNVIVANTTGVYLDTTPHDLRGEALFRDNTLGANDVGVRLHGPSQGALFTANVFLQNGAAATVDGRADTAGVRFDGNHWSAYQGYDLDGDGTGDLPYEARAVTGRLAERRPSVAWFGSTPAAGLLELLARAFPMFAPAPVLTDLHPRMRP